MRSGPFVGRGIEVLAAVTRRLAVRPSDFLGLTDPWERMLLDVAVAVHLDEVEGRRLLDLARVNPVMALMAAGMGHG